MAITNGNYLRSEMRNCENLIFHLEQKLDENEDITNCNLSGVEVREWFKDANDRNIKHAVFHMQFSPSTRDSEADYNTFAALLMREYDLEQHDLYTVEHRKQRIQGDTGKGTDTHRHYVFSVTDENTYKNREIGLFKMRNEKLSRMYELCVGEELERGSFDDHSYYNISKDTEFLNENADAIVERFDEIRHRLSEYEKPQSSYDRTQKHNLARYKMKPAELKQRMAQCRSIEEQAEVFKTIAEENGFSFQVGKDPARMKSPKNKRGRVGNQAYLIDGNGYQLANLSRIAGVKGVTGRQWIDLIDAANVEDFSEVVIEQPELNERQQQYHTRKNNRIREALENFSVFVAEHTERVEQEARAAIERGEAIGVEEERKGIIRELTKERNQAITVKESQDLSLAIAHRTWRWGVLDNMGRNESEYFKNAEFAQDIDELVKRLSGEAMRFVERLAQKSVQTNSDFGVEDVIRGKINDDLPNLDDRGFIYQRIFNVLLGTFTNIRKNIRRETQLGFFNTLQDGAQKLVTNWAQDWAKTHDPNNSKDEEQHIRAVWDLRSKQNINYQKAIDAFSSKGAKISQLLLQSIEDKEAWDALKNSGVDDNKIISDLSEIYKADLVAERLDGLVEQSDIKEIVEQSENLERFLREAKGRGFFADLSAKAYDYAYEKVSTTLNRLRESGIDKCEGWDGILEQNQQREKFRDLSYMQIRGHKIERWFKKLKAAEHNKILKANAEKQTELPTALLARLRFTAEVRAAREMLALSKFMRLKTYPSENVVGATISESDWHEAKQTEYYIDFDKALSELKTAPTQIEAFRAKLKEQVETNIRQNKSELERAIEQHYDDWQQSEQPQVYQYPRYGYKPAW